LEAEGVVADLVVVNESKTYAANESLFDRGVEEKESNEVKRCDLTVVLPAPDSPLATKLASQPYQQTVQTHTKKGQPGSLAGGPI
jgi:hypothetical protein